MNYAHAILAAALACAVGCKTGEEQVVGKPPADDSIAAPQPRNLTQKRRAVQRPRYPEPGLVVPGWPYVDERKTFVLSWKGGNKAAPLHAEPDPNSKLLGDVVWDQGEKVRWHETAVAIYQPNLVRAKEEWFVEGTPYSTGYVTDQEFVSRPVAPGQGIEIWGYAGAGQCYMGVDSKIILGICPPADSFAGTMPGETRAERYQPRERIWWIQIAGERLSGWVPVDDRFVVDIVDE